MTTENGVKNIKELEDLISNIKSLVYDLDAVSSYPNNTLAANVSKDTTHRELKSISGIERDEFIMDNINLLYGTTNAVEYCNNIFGMPSMFTLIDTFNKK